MMHAAVTIQIAREPSPLTPAWMGEVAAFAQVLTHTGMLHTIQEKVRFARAHFGHYELIDFVAVLIGYMLSYEWKGNPGAKVKYRVSRKDGDLFGFAGLYDMWHDPTSGDELVTCCTTLRSPMRWWCPSTTACRSCCCQKTKSGGSTRT